MQKTSQKGQRKAVPAPTLTVGHTDQDCTPLAQRSFIPIYTLTDAAHGITVTMEQGALYCGGVSHGCKWCRSHGKSNHLEARTDRVTLAVDIVSLLPTPKGVNARERASLSMEVTAEQLDVLIVHLGATRDRLRADRVLE